jgi:hypothetical protein
MQEISHDPVVAQIATQIGAIGAAGLAAGTAASALVTALAPAGADEVSAQATMAFMSESGKALAMNSAALEELIRASTAIMKIANMYEAVDGAEATSLESAAAQLAATTVRAGESAAALADSATARQLAQLVTAASPLMQQGMQIAQSVQSATGGMSGGAGAGGMAPKAAANPRQDDRDAEVEERLPPSGTETGATGGPSTGPAAPVQAPRHAKPEAAPPLEIDL